MITGTGKEQKAYRESMQIGRKLAANVHHATRASKLVKLPLNQFVTINYSKTACQPSEASAAFRRLLGSWFARWLRRHPKNHRQRPPTYVWCFEAAGGQIAVHWLVHIPRGLIREFGRTLPTWIAATTGEVDDRSVVKHRRIYNLIGVRRYILKGMDPHVAKQWAIKASDQGIVIGKRCGFSRNLGPVARTAAGYRSLRHFGKDDYQ